MYRLFFKINNLVIEIAIIKCLFLYKKKNNL